MCTATADLQRGGFLVVVDDSDERHEALQFAGGRARSVVGRVALMYCIVPAEFEFWSGVGELMREEAREEAEATMAIHADYAKNLTNGTPILYVREADIRYDLLQLIYASQEIILLVLCAAPQPESTGPFITFLIANAAPRSPAPIDYVPVHLTNDKLHTAFY